jgi:hypothetical protein
VSAFSRSRLAAAALRTETDMLDHTVKAFTEELDALVNEVARMGGLAETAVSEAIAAVARRETNLAQGVIERDAKIDAAWDSFFDAGPSVTDDFMAERATQAQPGRESF